jgi:hypothetical protein
MNKVRTLFIAFGAGALLGTIGGPSARADEDGWRRHEREREWRNEHERREWCEYHPYQCERPPAVIYQTAPPPAVVYETAPPPVVVAPPPTVVYQPAPVVAPAPSIDIVVPLRLGH